MTASRAERRSQAALDECSPDFETGRRQHGEHGIGLAKKRCWPLAASEEVRALHRTIKRALVTRHIESGEVYLSRKPQMEHR